jgi:hypothetical protein
VRNSRLLRELIAHFGLNLDGLNVYTEAASGHYAYCPVLAALAGAKHVTAQVNDSRFGLAREIIEKTYQLAKVYGVAEKIECIDRRSHDQLAQADIVTNSGHVRPIDRDLINVLKKTAVIPLMWETWEFRQQDFDLASCKESGILTLGTNEQSFQCDMRPFIALTALKLLLTQGYDGGKILLIGNSPLPALPVFDHIKRLGIDVVWASDDPDAQISYKKIANHFSAFGQDYSHLLVAEHKNPCLLLGQNGLLTGSKLREINPGLRIVVMCGNVDLENLILNNMFIFPKVIQPFGTISYQPYELGPRPVLTLYAAGLKIGEQMTRARLEGNPPNLAAALVLKEGLACDYMGENSWC